MHPRHALDLGRLALRTVRARHIFKQPGRTMHCLRRHLPAGILPCRGRLVVRYSLPAVPAGAVHADRGFDAVLELCCGNGIRGFIDGLLHADTVANCIVICDAFPATVPVSKRHQLGHSFPATVPILNRHRLGHCEPIRDEDVHQVAVGVVVAIGVIHNEAVRVAHSVRVAHHVLVGQPLSNRLADRVAAADLDLYGAALPKRLCSHRRPSSRFVCGVRCGLLLVLRRALRAVPTGNLLGLDPGGLVCRLSRGRGKLHCGRHKPSNVHNMLARILQRRRHCVPAVPLGHGKRIVGRHLSRHLRAVQCGQLQLRGQHYVPAVPERHVRGRRRVKLHGPAFVDGDGIGDSNGIGHRHGHGRRRRRLAHRLSLAAPHCRC